MPRTYERAFRVRHYETDAYGHVNHAQYVRYMQEAALEASADAGYSVAWYTAQQRQWLIRETRVTYLHPLTYGDTVIVKTWVTDFRRVRSRRAYHLRRADSGEAVAEATTDWVYLDTARQRPTTIPPDMRSAFFPDGAPPDTPQPRDPFPEPPPAPPGAFHVARRARWRDIDAAGHVNNAMYIAYLEDASVEVAAAHHWPMDRMMREGFGSVARDYRIEYRQPARLGDDLDIVTYIVEARRTNIVRAYAITRRSDGALLVRARVRWVWVDLATGRPTRFAPDVLADFAPNAAEGVTL